MAPLRETFYRKLLHLLRAPFRREAEEAMLECFRRQYLEAADEGLRARVRFWFRILYDLALTAWAERRRSPQANAESGRPGRSNRREITQMTKDLIDDLKLTWRSTMRRPGLALAAVLTLSLAVGANATVFSLVNALFLQAPPEVREPERLVRIAKTNKGQGQGALGYPDYLHYRDHSRTFEGVMAYDPDSKAITAGIGGERWPLTAWLVSGNYFEVLGVMPALGRWFLAEENVTPGTHPVAVISHGLWRRAFGGSSAAPGSRIVLRGQTFTVVGVTPADFRGLSPLEPTPDLWVPIMMQPLLAPAGGAWALERVPNRSWSWLRVTGRLTPRATLESAREDLKALASHLEEAYPQWNEGVGVSLTPSYRFNETQRTGLLNLTLILFAATAAVLLVAGSNLAILLLARGASRTHDLGVRMALGAGRGRLIQMTLAESVALCLAGGVGGAVLSYWLVGTAASLLPVNSRIEVHPDAAVLAFSLAISLLTALTFGAWPAWKASRFDVASVLGGNESRTGLRQLDGRLVSVQVALTVALVGAALLFGRSLIRAENVPMGFGTKNRLVVTLDLRRHGYTTEEGRQLVLRVLESLKSRPEVIGAASAHLLPFNGIWADDLVSQENPGLLINTAMNVVTPGYFEVMGSTLVRGRPFSTADDQRSPPSIVVNQAFADLVWPDKDPLGKRVLMNGESYEVIGLSQNANYRELAEPPLPQAFVSLLQYFDPRMSLIIRTVGPPLSFAGAARAALGELDPMLAIDRVWTIEAAVDRQIGRYRVPAVWLSLFGVLALALSMVGLYGVQTYLVSRRIRDIGIRMALGAERARVGCDVVWRALQLAFWGAVPGLLLYLLIANSVRHLLYGGSPSDPWVVGGVLGISTFVACLAAALPAWRAARVDPILALRTE